MAVCQKRSNHSVSGGGALDSVERGRTAYADRAWASAADSLLEADEVTPLGAEDLELLATSLYMLGRMDEALGVLERAHEAYLDDGEPLRAVRCACYLWVNLALRGELGRATGWFGRAQRPSSAWGATAPSAATS